MEEEIDMKKSKNSAVKNIFIEFMHYAIYITKMFIYIFSFFKKEIGLNVLKFFLRAKLLLNSD